MEDCLSDVDIDNAYIIGITDIMLFGVGSFLIYHKILIPLAAFLAIGKLLVMGEGMCRSVNTQGSTFIGSVHALPMCIFFFCQASLVHHVRELGRLRNVMLGAPVAHGHFFLLHLHLTFS